MRASNRSEFRIKGLQRKLERFGESVNWSCNLDDVTDYLMKRRDEVSNRTLSDDIQSIKQFFKSVGIHWIDSIKSPIIRRKKPKIVNKEDIQDLLEELTNANVDDKYIFRAKTAVLLSAVTGMRPWEIYRLEWEDVDLENRIINLPAEKTKTKEERIVIFNYEAQEYLTELKHSFPKQPFYHKAVYFVTNRMTHKPELKLKHCRKFFSQEWDRRGLPTSIKEMLLGHFGSVDLRNYNGQSAEDLKVLYDKADIKILG